MSEHGFGVAVLTDSKYGYSAFGDTLRISLLRAPRNPDPEADRGTHSFAYALLPHARHAGRTRAWWPRRRRSTRRSAGARCRAGSLASATGGLVLDTVKRAEDSDALILRLYEPHGGRGTARVRVPATARLAREHPRGTRRRRCRSRTARSSSRSGPWEIVTVYASSSSSSE